MGAAMAGAMSLVLWDAYHPLRVAFRDSTSVQCIWGCGGGNSVLWLSARSCRNLPMVCMSTGSSLGAIRNSTQMLTSSGQPLRRIGGEGILCSHDVELGRRSRKTTVRCWFDPIWRAGRFGTVCGLVKPLWRACCWGKADSLAPWSKTACELIRRPPEACRSPLWHDLDGLVVWTTSLLPGSCWASPADDVGLWERPHRHGSLGIQLQDSPSLFLQPRHGISYLGNEHCPESKWNWFSGWRLPLFKELEKETSYLERRITGSNMYFITYEFIIGRYIDM